MIVNVIGQYKYLLYRLFRPVNDFARHKVNANSTMLTSKHISDGDSNVSREFTSTRVKKRSSVRMNSKEEDGIADNEKLFLEVGYLNSHLFIIKCSLTSESIGTDSIILVKVVFFDGSQFSDVALLSLLKIGNLNILSASNNTQVKLQDSHRLVSIQRAPKLKAYVELLSESALDKNEIPFAIKNGILLVEALDKEENTESLVMDSQHLRKNGYDIFVVEVKTPKSSLTTDYQRFKCITYKKDLHYNGIYSAVKVLDALVKVKKWKKFPAVVKKKRRTD
ncbi:hypothetical protein K501DRAFT_265413 [Backusella circina FSU 941]|nr:hypothetical protein K501DRAFT_265413 [Backusella circina FSU 941]